MAQKDLALLRRVKTSGVNFSYLNGSFYVLNDGELRMFETRLIITREYLFPN